MRYNITISGYYILAHLLCYCFDARNNLAVIIAFELLLLHIARGETKNVGIWTEVPWEGKKIKLLQITLLFTSISPFIHLPIVAVGLFLPKTKKYLANMSGKLSNPAGCEAINMAARGAIVASGNPVHKLFTSKHGCHHCTCIEALIYMFYPLGQSGTTIFIRN